MIDPELHRFADSSKAQILRRRVGEKIAVFDVATDRYGWRGDRWCA